MPRLRVAVCDDIELVRRSLVAYLESDPGIEVSGTYASGADLLNSLEHDPADIVLLDVRMPGLDGPTVAERLARGPSRGKVIYISSYPDEVPVSHALSGVVAGCLSKDLPPADLVRAVHLAAGGTSLISGPLLRQFESRPLTRRETFARDEREQGVLDLLCRGYTNDQIARSLNRSASSVKQILSVMTRRAGVASRTELVLYLLDADGGR